MFLAAPLNSVSLPSIFNFSMKTSIQHRVHDGELLPLMESFYTIQGEGSYAGAAAHFLRLGGCDVGCHWCDVKESWDASLHAPVSVTAMADEAAQKARIAVITGGEPLMYPLGPLTEALKSRGLRTHMETSGAYGLSGEWDWICLSPKKNMLPKKSVYDAAHELKAIIYNKHDFLFAEQQAALVNENAVLFLQVEWSRREVMTPMIVDYVKENPKWRISVQTHKYLDIP